MREILFRGKRCDNNEWVFGSYLLSRIGKNAIPAIAPYAQLVDMFGNGELYQIDPSTVGQYTGLTDKNGVKIFEGDRVRIPMYRGMANKPVLSTGTIEWRNGAFHVTWDEEMYGRHFVGYLEDVEVVGNIHNNYVHQQ